MRLKRAYEAASADDGERYLVERLWPRGVAKEPLRLTAWLREVAPSAELRRWFGHDASRWTEFRTRYERELRAPDRREAVDRLVGRARRGRVTLVFAARDPERCSATVLRRVLLDEIAGKQRGGDR